jgi:hypothetical protein
MVLLLMSFMDITILAIVVYADVFGMLVWDISLGLKLVNILECTSVK